MATNPLSALSALSSPAGVFPSVPNLPSNNSSATSGPIESSGVYVDESGAQITTGTSGISTTALAIYAAIGLAVYLLFLRKK